MASGVFAALAVVLALEGCVSTPAGPATESQQVAKRYGLPSCQVSVPLTEAEVLDSARSDGNPSPESNYEWIAITSSLKPGDELRRVICRKGNDKYFYALMRDGKITLRFHSMIFD